MPDHFFVPPMFASPRAIQAGGEGFYGLSPSEGMGAGFALASVHHIDSPIPRSFTMYRYFVPVWLACSSALVFLPNPHALAESYTDLPDIDLASLIVSCKQPGLADPETCPDVLNEGLRRAANPPDLSFLNGRELSSLLFGCNESMVADRNLCTTAGQASQRLRIISLVDGLTPTDTNAGGAQDSQALPERPLGLTIEDARSACVLDGYPESSARLQPGGYSCEW